MSFAPWVAAFFFVFGPPSSVGVGATDRAAHAVRPARAAAPVLAIRPVRFRPWFEARPAPKPSRATSLRS